jgi:hypothetical protein
MAQATAIEPILVSQNRRVQQEVAMQIPVPGIITLHVKMRIDYQLLSVEGGVARVQQAFSMDF